MTHFFISFRLDRQSLSVNVTKRSWLLCYDHLVNGFCWVAQETYCNKVRIYYTASFAYRLRDMKSRGCSGDDLLTSLDVKSATHHSVDLEWRHPRDAVTSRTPCFRLADFSRLNLLQTLKNLYRNVCRSISISLDLIGRVSCCVIASLMWWKCVTMCDYCSRPNSAGSGSGQAQQLFYLNRLK